MEDRASFLFPLLFLFLFPLMTTLITLDRYHDEDQAVSISTDVK